MSWLYGFVISMLASVSAGPATENYKEQFCTDPRTMQKHAAYTEWADAYSCTRHRCQPGGRNLAIYTVGCKRVEAPESAIECEEVVEDTNMQFPFCCTRLRCLVVVRGEVWTRVLGQPWEALPAAPWSHMYKMKKPPPPNGSLLPKNTGAGPVYELAPESDADGQKVLRASKKTTDSPDCNDPKPAQVPDIVIALATEPEPKEQKKTEIRHKRRKTTQAAEDQSDKEQRNNEVEFEDAVVITERAPDASEEKANLEPFTRKFSKGHQAAWTEIPQKEWNEQEPSSDIDNTPKESAHVLEGSDDEKKKPALQALVDAIGTRMRDIENVVQKMSEKVHHAKPGDPDNSVEKRVPDQLSDAEVVPSHARHRAQPMDHGKDLVMRPKQPALDAEYYKRFTVRSRGSKYLHTTDGPSEPPLFVEDGHLNGYFSDASNSVQRRVSSPKEPAQYVAPVESRHKTHILGDSSDETRKRSKHSHKKKGKGHKKRHGKDKRKRLRQSSAELDRNTVSLEENSAIIGV